MPSRRRLSLIGRSSRTELVNTLYHGQGLFAGTSGMVGTTAPRCFNCSSVKMPALISAWVWRQLDGIGRVEAFDDPIEFVEVLHPPAQRSRFGAGQQVAARSGTGAPIAVDVGSEEALGTGDGASQVGHCQVLGLGGVEVPEGVEAEAAGHGHHEGPAEHVGAIQIVGAEGLPQVPLTVVVGAGEELDTAHGAGRFAAREGVAEVVADIADPPEGAPASAQTHLKPAITRKAAGEQAGARVV